MEANLLLQWLGQVSKKWCLFNELTTPNRSLHICDRKKCTISLSHSHYVSSLFQKYKYESSNPVATPMELGQKLTKATSPNPTNAQSHPYQAVVGFFMHAAVVTWLDIAHAVQRVSQSMSNPDITHWSAVKRILRYLNGAKDYCLTFGHSKNNTTATAYSVADYGNDIWKRVYDQRRLFHFEF